MAGAEPEEAEAAADKSKADASNEHSANGDTTRPSYYQRIDLLPCKGDPRYLVFIPAPGAPEPSEQMVALRREYSKVARVVRELFSDKREIREKVFELMERSADRGFVGPTFSLSDGSSNLSDLRDVITDYALNVRNARLVDYNRLLWLFGVLPTAVGIAILQISTSGCLANFGQAYLKVINLIVVGILIVGGAATCVWAEFVLRVHDGLTFDELLSIDVGRWHPNQRVAIVIVISFLFAYLLSFDVIQVGLGALLLNQFIEKPLVALALGGVTAFAFSFVRGVFYRLKPEERPQ